jgi:hypothetical protein
VCLLEVYCFCFCVETETKQVLGCLLKNNLALEEMHSEVAVVILHNGKERGL